MNAHKIDDIYVSPVDKAEIFLCSEIGRCTEEVYSKKLALLPSGRRIKSEKYVYFKDKSLCLIAYLLLHHGIARTFNSNISGLDFTYNDYGKPYLKELSSIHFNISHCNHAVVCAISDQNVGIDIQDVQSGTAKLSRMVLTERERKMIQSSNQPDEAFTRFWVMKESFLKCSGVGLNQDMKSLDFSDSTADIVEYEGYFINVQQLDTCYLSVCSSAYKNWQITEVYSEIL
jgi:4'-phosphopantetheinyl transferase